MTNEDGEYNMETPKKRLRSLRMNSDNSLISHASASETPMTEQRILRRTRSQTKLESIPEMGFSCPYSTPQKISGPITTRSSAQKAERPPTVEIISESSCDDDIKEIGYSITTPIRRTSTRVQSRQEESVRRTRSSLNKENVQITTPKLNTPRKSTTSVSGEVAPRETPVKKVMKKPALPVAPPILKRDLSRDERFNIARKSLNLDLEMTQLSCREEEFSVLNTFIEGSIEAGGTGNIQYISGMPGTGKTASIKCLVNALRRKVAAGELPYFFFIELNALSLSHSNDAFAYVLRALQLEDEKYQEECPDTYKKKAKYTQILHKRSAVNMSYRTAYLQLGDYFNCPDPFKPPLVLLLDEVDFLVTKEQRVLYSFFDWPTRGCAKLVLLAVANTIDLPLRFTPRIASRLGHGQMHFKPYNRMQLQQIVMDRLKQVLATEDFPLEDMAVVLCAMNIASGTGDVRKMLQICQYALDTCAGDKVTTTDMHNALKESLSSSISTSVKCSSLGVRLMLLGILLTLKSSSISDRWVLEDGSMVISSFSLWLKWKNLTMATPSISSDVDLGDFLDILRVLVAINYIRIISPKVVECSKAVEESAAYMLTAPPSDNESVASTPRKSTRKRNSVSSTPGSASKAQGIVEVAASSEYLLHCPIGSFTVQLIACDENSLRQDLLNDEDLPSAGL